MTPTASVRVLLRRGSLFPRAAGRPAGIRRKCTKTKSLEEPPEREPKTITIQGPSWVWLEPVGRPFRAYSRAQARRPYVVQLLSTITIWFFGDLSAQMISASEEDSYSPTRALRSVFIGSLTSIPNYRWFMFLVWPAVTAFSFTFIPPQFRSIFAGFIAIGWQSWLTLLNQRAAAQEKADHEKQRDQRLRLPQPELA
ncbi:integral membrane mpv17 pmp22 [Diplodia corticola]|uniref:Integral membrane mpv17 pmp22 n=1 Tax=Diplodia corticola TaxID=236234 RepID=A0A1J9R6N6_9PEZI|nr:integral membrane mpv17 pmp22 [Diplodia corticola]OJD37190.1 integral membrane mpv17 pmp22 [Diplodia corticola]